MRVVNGRESMCVDVCEPLLVWAQEECQQTKQGEEGQSVSLPVAGMFGTVLQDSHRSR